MTHNNENKVIAELQEKVLVLEELLRRFVTPPLNYHSKKQLVEEAQLLLERWEEI